MAPRQASITFRHSLFTIEHSIYPSIELTGRGAARRSAGVPVGLQLCTATADCGYHDGLIAVAVERQVGVARLVGRHQEW